MTEPALTDDAWLSRLRAGIDTTSADETRSVAARLAPLLPRQVTLALEGDLGTGKSTFVRGLAAAWGVRGQVASPTYNVMLVHRGERLLVHVDAYRLRHPEDLDALLLDDLLHGAWCLAVEWPGLVLPALPGPVMHLAFSIPRPGEHRVRLVPGAA